MKAIGIVLVLIGTIAALAFWVGIIMLFFKKRRPKGKRVALISFITMIAAPVIGISLYDDVDKQARVERQLMLDEQARKAGFSDYEDQHSKQQAILDNQTMAILDKQAREAGYKDHGDQVRAERQTKAMAAEEARIKALNGFPDLKAQLAAKAAGIARYEAYRLLQDRNAITRYCTYNDEGHAIEKAKHAEMDTTSDDAKQTKIWDKYETSQKQLLSDFNAELGLQGYELTSLSIAGHWLSYCRASEENWSVLTEQQTKDASRSDADDAKEALNAFYLWNLSNETSPFFSKKRFSAVSCQGETLNDMRFVGCQLMSVSYKSKWQMFVLGRLDNGNLAVSPINGDTSGKLNIAQARFYDSADNKRIFVQAYDQPRAYLANYAGQRIDIQVVRQLFE